MEIRPILRPPNTRPLGSSMGVSPAATLPIGMPDRFTRYTPPQQAPASAVRFGIIVPATAPVPTLKSRFQGCLMGVAVADALGCNVETQTAEQIRATYGIHREITGGQARPHFYNWPKGAVTDDTEMTLLMAESLIQHPQWNPWDLRDRIVAWSKSNPEGLGKTTRRVLQSLESLRPETDDIGRSAREAWEELKVSGNGSLMRCSPIGLLYHQDPDKLRQVSESSCAITHYAPECQASTLAYNRVLAAILNGEITDKPSIQRCYDKAATEIEPLSPETARLLRAIPTMRQETVSSKAGTLDTLQTALWAFYHFADLEEAVVTVVNLGGDTDTNGAVTGALLGARLGEGAIPERWAHALQNPGLIRQTASRLYDTYTALPVSASSKAPLPDSLPIGTESP